MKRKNRMIVNIAMAVLLPLLMAYSLIGEEFHEIIGTVMFGLFIVHNIMKRGWYAALFKGKYTARRIFQTVLNVLLLIFMILQPLSGILMSKHLYTSLPVFPISAQARSVHMLLAYWGYVLLCIHAGTHLMAPMRKLVRKSRMIFAAVCAVLGFISVYGGMAFIKRGFPGYMSGKMVFVFFDFDEPRLSFFLDYLAIMILFMTIGCLVVYGLVKTTEMRKAVKK